MTIVWGILCLGFIVFIHELGHFIVARMCGVTVESFSIGMGPVLLHKTINGTDYRLSLLPVGGYCGMKGDTAFKDALEQNLLEIPAESDGFYANPVKRALIAFAGPFMNLLFAVAAFTVIALTGYTYYSADSRIILATELYADTPSAAREAGLKTGDRILSINGKPVETFSDISELIGTNPRKTVEISVQRGNERLSFTATTDMDTDSGLGKLGVMNWVDPIVSGIETDSPAAEAGLQPGDRITAVNGSPVFNTVDLQKTLPSGDSAAVSYVRGETEAVCTLTVPAEASAGLRFSVPAHEAQRYSFFPAIGRGVAETGNLIALTFKSIGLLFQGVDVTQAVSGPVRITVMLGDTVKSGFEAGFRAGLVSTLNFLALISISLCIMNLLPIPILDGGIILFAIIELLRKKQIRPKIIYYIQFAGVAFIVLLFGVALFSDIRYVLAGF
ncbi:RIP metalloprotease RseP [Treponema brennaborense]|uniref:Zinc metalloprotease n=1 Tax=Treponema brennaborense (strain DSM 12168 / CIP 105900 / DD5/3) TaxID=906968 RepID=F4LN85_TREBD|nr:RIP metalloprotease RseP [Treponema brennaborense]AEE16850.1 membrane-associated zinc metalloprotease [Treponema brennaborense DSM 12168]